MSKLTQSSVWKSLQKRLQPFDGLHMRSLFATDPDRFERFSAEACGIFLDYSKNLIDGETMDLLFTLAAQADVEGWRASMFAGERINTTENRPVLHTALRRETDKPLVIDDDDVMPGVASVLAQMREFSDAVRDGSWTGATGKRITDVVNVGIGGSNLGPRMLDKALRPYADTALRLHFVSSAGGGMIGGVLAEAPWESTLFLISSKTFTTEETILNARTARDWLVQQSGGEDALSHHFLAITANKTKATDFGIPAENVFELWDWVGGRYSLWSSVGLSAALAIGMDRFEELLAGARAMDEHFQSAPLQENLPVILAMLGVWYINFFNAKAHAIIPYDHRLSRFPAYLQQVDMESNGKAVDRDGQATDYDTAPVIWGKPGTDCQHSIFQKLHQGTDFLSADFLAAAEPHTPVGDHHKVLLANFLAQTEALMMGNTEDDVRADLESRGASVEETAALLPHKLFLGNRPTNTLLFKRLDPFTMGALIALYEHKVFVQGVVWNINSFDQWGVELGKNLADKMLGDLDNDGPAHLHDASTNGLINRLKEFRRCRGIR
ncbi:MAG: glucose-6-phosphate isomerase [Alphaproteobacteria bacterium]|nr:glucose-6-phosphate isomerase [Alphaproteobacteria bacterium]